MKSHEQKYAEAVVELTARLTRWGVDDPETKAREFMQGMVHEGWRGAVAEFDLPSRGPKYVPPPEVVIAGANECRAHLGLPPKTDPAALKPIPEGEADE